MTSFRQLLCIPKPAYTAKRKRSAFFVTGQQAYITAGTFSWVAPAGVTSVSIVCVGTGGHLDLGGQGGSLGYKNNYTVVPGDSYTVVVGARGGSNAAGGNSYFVNTSVVKGRGGGQGGSTWEGDGGGVGGDGQYGGGGAGGYGPSQASSGAGFATSGVDGGGSGAMKSTASPAVYAGGGGVGILGKGTGGAPSTNLGGVDARGRGGSGGADGSDITGGDYGGGSSHPTVSAGIGAVRIIWPGTTRSFPSTNTGNL